MSVYDIIEVEMVSRRDWSELPQEILEEIAERLTCCEDCIRFRGVCRSWRATIVGRRNYTFFSKMLPWLVLPQQKDESDNDDDDTSTVDLSTRSFFSLSERKLHPLNLPEAVDCTDCWGSPYGWFLTYRDPELSIVNLLSNVSIHLPPLPSFESLFRNPTEFYVRRLLLSISPSSSSALLPLQDQFLAFLILRGESKTFGFWRPGDITWTAIETPSTINEDILQIDNQFYIVNNDGLVRRFDINNGDDRVAHDFASPPEDIELYEGRRCYLVEMLGELHLVVRYIYLEASPWDHYNLDHPNPFEEHHEGITRSFDIFRLDLKSGKWEKVYDLGDYAFFVGNNTSFSLLVSENSGCKRNAIYFTDDYDLESFESSLNKGVGGSRSRGLDMGVFDLENDEVDTIFHSDAVVTLFAPAFWITPTLC